MTLVELLALLDKELNLIRRIKTQLTHEDFETLYGLCSPQEKVEITSAIKTKNESRIKEILKKKREQKYELWKIEDLRNYARGIGMAYYATLTKYELLTGIAEYELRIKREHSETNGSCKSGGLGYKPTAKAP